MRGLIKFCRRYCDTFHSHNWENNGSMLLLVDEKPSNQANQEDCDLTIVIR
jgi:hypothetical protein